MGTLRLCNLSGPLEMSRFPRYFELLLRYSNATNSFPFTYLTMSMTVANDHAVMDTAMCVTTYNSQSIKIISKF